MASLQTISNYSFCHPQGSFALIKTHQILKYNILYLLKSQNVLNFNSGNKTNTSCVLQLSDSRMATLSYVSGHGRLFEVNLILYLSMSVTSLWSPIKSSPL